jgi:hypothetical protein
VGVGLEGDIPIAEKLNLHGYYSWKPSLFVDFGMAFSKASKYFQENVLSEF